MGWDAFFWMGRLHKNIQLMLEFLKALLYINDLPDVICNIAIYADDTTLWVILCEMDWISEKFPPDTDGFCWNFVKSISPSRNENPEDFIVFLWMVPKLQLPKLWTFWPRHWIIVIYSILKMLPFRKF